MDERCHRRRNRRKKIGMNTNLEFNYFVIIILILFAFLKSFFCLGCIQHVLITSLFVVKWFKKLLLYTIPAFLNSDFV
jgi:hypothetical protein